MQVLYRKGMNMVPYINARLIGWADWVIKGKRVSGLSYPSQVSYARLAGGSSSNGAEFDESAWEVEQAVNALRSDLKVLVHDFYLRTTTVELLSRRMGCHRYTVYYNIHLAQVEVMGSLNDIAAGCFKPVDSSDKVVQHRVNCNSVRAEPAIAR